MIMNWRKAYFEAFRLVLYITVNELHVKNTGIFLPVTYKTDSYSGSRPSYIMLNFP